MIRKVLMAMGLAFTLTFARMPVEIEPNEGGGGGPVCTGSSNVPTCLILNANFSTSLGAFDNVMAGLNGHIDTTVESPYGPAESLVEYGIYPFFMRRDSWSGLSQDRPYNIAQNAGGVYVRSMCNGIANALVPGEKCVDIDNVELWIEGSGTTEKGDEMRTAIYGDVLTSLNSYSPPRKPIYDCFNEPELIPVFRTTNGNFGVNDEQHLIDAYAICYDAIADAYAAENEGTPKVIGPSFSSFPGLVGGFLFKEGSAGANYMENLGFTGDYGSVSFLEQLNEDWSTMKLDGLALHVFVNDYVMEWDTWVDGVLRAAIIEDIDDEGYTNLENAWGADVAGLPVYATEYLGAGQRKCFGGSNPGVECPATSCTGGGICANPFYINAGHAVVAIEALHAGGVDAAGKACWDDPADGSSGCSNKTLAGMLVPAGSTTPSEPRPLWWAYKYYADMAVSGRNRYAVSSEYLRVAALASHSGDDYSVLVGFTAASKNEQSGLTADTMEYTRVYFTGLTSTCTTLVADVIRFDGASYSALSTPSPTSYWMTKVSNVWTLLVPEYSEEEVVYITVDATNCTGE